MSLPLVLLCRVITNTLHKVEQVRFRKALYSLRHYVACHTTFLMSLTGLVLLAVDFCVLRTSSQKFGIAGSYGAKCPQLLEGPQTKQSCLSRG